MKIYISGPITGTSDYMERFATAQKELEARGYEVINPALINSNLPKSTRWDQYMEISLVLLKMCDDIYMLPGWEKSKGASLEYEIAKSLNMGVAHGAGYEPIYL